MSVEVRVRHVDDATSMFLAEVDFDNLHEVIPDIHKFGGFQNYESAELKGSFVYDPEFSPGQAYFEVLIDD